MNKYLNKFYLSSLILIFNFFLINSQEVKVQKEIIDKDQAQEKNIQNQSSLEKMWENFKTGVKKMLNRTNEGGEKLKSEFNEKAHTLAEKAKSGAQVAKKDIESAWDKVKAYMEKFWETVKYYSGKAWGGTVSKLSSKEDLPESQKDIKEKEEKKKE